VNIEIGGTLLATAFVMAVVLGAVTNRTNFCTMGAVSDWVNMGDTGRLRAWLTALAVALIGTTVMEVMEVINLDESRVPYRSANFAWPRYVLGGLMFGVGMSLAGGCGSKNLVRLGGGNLKSMFVLIITGCFAYLMTRTDFYGIVFLTWIGPLTPDLNQIGAASQELGQIVAATAGAEDVTPFRIGVSTLLIIATLGFTLSSADFRRSLDHLGAGIVIGALVAGAWYLTGGPMGQEWIEAAEFSDRPPEGVGMQSFTFVNPTADFIALILQGGNGAYVTFGVVTLAGMILGSGTYALLSRTFRFEWFMSWADFGRHALGGALMGLGGVLAIGCTIGQGVSGMSTMAAGSALAMGSIILASALTMKTEYYGMLYEDASFYAAFISSLADLKLVPASLRKLEAL
jgi:uncharacterized protein